MSFDELPGVMVRKVSIDSSSPRLVARTIQPRGVLRIDGDRPAYVQQYRPRVAQLTNVRIDSTGAVLLPQARAVVMESLWDESQYAGEFQTLRSRRPTERVAGPCGSLLTLWSDNYYHWLFDALGRLAVLRSTGRETDLPLLVPKHLSAFQAESLALAGVPVEKQIRLAGIAAAVETLIWTSPAAFVGFPSSFMVNWLRSTFGCQPKKGSRRLFIVRKSRKISNEDEIINLLGKFGFEIARPELLSFRDQVALFASAEFIVSPHGAGLANAAFGKDLKILEVFQPGYINTSLFELCRAAGHAYWYLIGQAADRKTEKYSDIVICPKLVGETVRQMLREA